MGAHPDQRGEDVTVVDVARRRPPRAGAFALGRRGAARGLRGRGDGYADKRSGEDYGEADCFTLSGV